ncbi:hypothetical protein HYT33_04470 [Candidatus Roizmanbacteria bacterium]|nr:hypothetical protein [Candidatus Roizmanbacteria bacterium]
MRGKREQGFSPIVAIVIAAVVLVGGYFVLQRSGKAPSIPGISLPGGIGLNPNCKYNDPDLCKYINRALSGDYFKGGVSFKSVTKDKSAKAVSEVVSETQGEDRSHFVILADGKETYNTIMIGNTVYLKDQKDGKWWKQTKEQKKEDGEGDEPEKKYDPKEIKKQLEREESKIAYKKVGKEQCDSRTCFKYEMVNPDFAEVTEYILFDDRDFILRKMISQTKDGTVTETTFAYENISINAPSPTKDVPQGQDIYLMGVPGVGGLDEKTTQDAEKLLQELQKQ